MEQVATSTKREKYFGPREPDGRRTGRVKSWVVNEMWDLHHEIARMLLVGVKNTVIAERLGCSPQTVSNVRNSPVVKEKLAIMQGARDANSVDVAKEIQKLAPKAIEFHRTILEAGKDNVEVTNGQRFKSAESILNRAGFAPQPPAQRHEHVHAHLTAEQLEGIKERARKAGLLSEGNESFSD